MLGRLLAKIAVGTGRESLELAAAFPAQPGAAEWMREFQNAAASVQQRARQAQEAARVFLLAEEVDVLAENMHVVMQEQDRLNALAQRSGDDARKWAQLGDRLRAVTSETRALEAQMTLAAGLGDSADRLRSLQKRIAKQRELVDKLLPENKADAPVVPAPGKELAAPIGLLARATADAARDLLNLKRELTGRPINAVRQLLGEVQPAWVQFDKLRQEVQTAMAASKVPAEAKPRSVARRWEARRGLFKSYGDLEETRGNADSYFVSDLRAVTLALQGLQSCERSARLGEEARGSRSRLSPDRERPRACRHAGWPERCSRSTSAGRFIRRARGRPIRVTGAGWRSVCGCCRRSWGKRNCPSRPAARSPRRRRFCGRRKGAGVEEREQRDAGPFSPRTPAAGFSAGRGARRGAW